MGLDYFLWTLFILLCFCNTVSDVRKIRVKTGEDAELPCLGRPDEVRVLRWTRHDLSGTVLFYRDGKMYNDDQNPLFSNRVNLKDPGLSRGNLSVILINVTSQDSGVYRCYAVHKVSGEKMYISRYIELAVAESGVHHMTVKTGEDAQLSCRGRPEEVRVLRWTRENLPGTVLFYRDGKMYNDDQNAQFLNRVNLTDPGLKRGILSVILINVTSQDSGVYRCFAVHKVSGVIKRVSHNINLTVAEPDLPQLSESDSADTDHVTTEGGTTDRRFRGVIIGEVLVVLVVVAVVLIVMCIRNKKGRDRTSSFSSNTTIVSCKRDPDAY